jgi:hypothetical protein
LVQTYREDVGMGSLMMTGSTVSEGDYCAVWRDKGSVGWDKVVSGGGGREAQDTRLDKMRAIVIGGNAKYNELMKVVREDAYQHGCDARRSMGMAVGVLLLCCVRVTMRTGVRVAVAIMGMAVALVAAVRMRVSDSGVAVGEIGAVGVTF